MFVKPCKNCPHTNNGCEIKAAKLVALRGLGVTSLHFRCARYLAEFPAGQRVEFELRVPMGETGWETDVEETMRGTVMRPFRGGVLVWVDDDDDAEHDPPTRNPIRLFPNRLRVIDGTRALCPDCKQPEGTKPWPRDDGEELWFCPRCAGWEYKGLDEWGLKSWVKPPAEAVTTGERA
jgi:hypothetical protein